MCPLALMYLLFLLPASPAQQTNRCAENPNLSHIIDQAHKLAPPELIDLGVKLVIAPQKGSPARLVQASFGVPDLLRSRANLFGWETLDIEEEEYPNTARLRLDLRIISAIHSLIAPARSMSDNACFRQPSGICTRFGVTFFSNENDYRSTRRPQILGVGRFVCLALRWCRIQLSSLNGVRNRGW
jgi:hypothetical protein